MHCRADSHSLATAATPHGPAAQSTRTGEMWRSASSAYNAVQKTLLQGIFSDHLARTLDIAGPRRAKRIATISEDRRPLQRAQLCKRGESVKRGR